MSASSSHNNGQGVIEFTLILNGKPKGSASFEGTDGGDGNFGG